jgi:hypothetical protein
MSKLTTITAQNMSILSIFYSVNQPYQASISAASLNFSNVSQNVNDHGAILQYKHSHILSILSYRYCYCIRYQLIFFFYSISDFNKNLLCLAGTKFRVGIRRILNWPDIRPILKSITGYPAEFGLKLLMYFKI